MALLKFGVETRNNEDLTETLSKIRPSNGCVIGPAEQWTWIPSSCIQIVRKQCHGADRFIFVYDNVGKALGIAVFIVLHRQFDAHDSVRTIFQKEYLLKQ